MSLAAESDTQITSPTCRTIHSSLAKSVAPHHSSIEKLDSWTELTDHNNVKIEEDVYNQDTGTWETAAAKATQYVFNGQDIIAALEQEADVGYIKEKANLQT